MNKKNVNIIGGGLAGSEAAHYLLKKDYVVNLYEMKPIKFSPAHKNDNFAELVCSNSFKSEDCSTAAGILKNELRKLNSLLIKIADDVKVPSGASLSVDRELFSQRVTQELKQFKNLNVINSEVTSLDMSIPTIVATGPLTSDAFSSYLLSLLGDNQMYFYDAIAPIVDADTLNEGSYFIANRYDKGETKDFINCPMTKDEYLVFYDALINAETVSLKEFEDLKVYEACMPVEVLAKRGVDALRFGPLKPVGLTDPRTGRYPYACVQLRKENLQDNSYNLVGFQTNLTYAAQKQVLSLIPALKGASITRYGTMHRNSYICSPNLLNKFNQSKTYPQLFVAGQVSGVEGYIESISSGLYCAINLDRYLTEKSLIDFTNSTIIGGLGHYISTASPDNFQPMGCNIGLLKPLDEKIRNKKEKNTKLYEISDLIISNIAKEING